MTGRLHALVEAAAREADCTVAQILGDQRRGSITSARHRAMAAAYEEGFTMRQIGAAFKKDHKVVAYALKKSRGEEVSPIPKEHRTAVHNRDGYACVYCGTYTDIGIDHATPRSRGGEDTEENLVTCCQRCNSRKGDKTREEFLEFLKREARAASRWWLK